MGLKWKIEGGNLIIQLIEYGDGGEWIEDEISIPLVMLKPTK